MMSAMPNEEEIPLQIVGSTKFGRYPKISIEQTYNMIISDGFLVDYAGYKKQKIINEGPGRAIFSSANLGKMIAVINDGVYAITNLLTFSQVGTLETSTGDVSIDENDGFQIAICDKKNIYIYNYNLSTFTKVSLDFLPGYIAFQDGYFVSVDLDRQEWRLSDPNDGLSWPPDGAHVGKFQTKPDRPVAALRMPGKGNLLFILGSTVTEAWVDTGAQLFPYQKSTGFNIDYGTVNSGSIATSDRFIAWIGINEKSGPVLMASSGGDVQQITTDGINYKLSNLTNSQNCFGIMFKQDGHLIYQFTFPDDNLTYAYDFNTQLFFTICDHEMNAHPAFDITFFNNKYYFVSYKDGAIYEFGTQFTNLDGNEMPRIRVTPPMRRKDSQPFIIRNLNFTIEQGHNSTLQSVDLSLSEDGGESFGGYERRDLNPQGRRPNRLDWWQLGYGNDITAQFRFWGQGRFVATDGVASVYR